MSKILQIATVRAHKSNLALGRCQAGELGLWMLSDGAPKWLCHVSEDDGLFFAIAADSMGVDLDNYDDGDDDEEEGAEHCLYCDRPDDSCDCYCDACGALREECECEE